MTLYRTYRSQRFSDLLGQAAVTTTLQEALRKQRLAHAYLFSGPRGTGKTSAARILARALACLNPIQAEGKAVYEPCNQCPNCLAILGNQTPDLIEIDAASNRGIEDIRSLREQLTYHPTQLARKVYIIDEVHMLTTEAFNALLKSLEEPPPYCLFILATTELQKVPLTIRSRCQLLRFERGSVEAIQTKLDKIISAEKLKVEPGVSALIAKHAEGGFRDAETLLESLTTQRQPLTLEEARNSLGLLPTERVDELLSACLNADATAALTLLNTISVDTASAAERLTGQLIEALRLQLASSNPKLQTGKMLEYLLEAYILQRSAPFPLLPLEIACLNICQLNSNLDGQGKENSISKSSPADRPVEERHSITPTLSTSNPASPTAQSSDQATTPSIPRPSLGGTEESPVNPRAAWKRMIEQVSQDNLILGQALRQVVFHKAQDKQIIIEVRYQFHADKLNEKKNRQRIHQLLEELTGRDWDVSYKVNPDLKVPRPKELPRTDAEEALAVFSAKSIP